MRYWLLAAISALSAFGVFALAGSAAARLASAALRRDMVVASARARVLFRVRMLPAFAAVTAGFGIALVFFRLEDPATTERISVTLLLAALAGGFLLASGIWRAVAAWRSTSAFVREWQRRGRAIERPDAPMPAFAVDEAFPTVAVAGILRPRLFIAECVLRECSTDEVAAMVAHECAHVDARDNVKRLLMRFCPDVFGAAGLERAWRAAAEEAADARAATLNPSARLDLAQALIHVARLAAPRAPQLASAFYLGGSIDERIRRLVEPPAVTAAPRWMRYAIPAALLVVPSVAAGAAPLVHAVMEAAIRLLP